MWGVERGHASENGAHPLPWQLPQSEVCSGCKRGVGWLKGVCVCGVHEIVILLSSMAHRAFRDQYTFHVHDHQASVHSQGTMRHGSRSPPANFEFRIVGGALLYG